MRWVCEHRAHSPQGVKLKQKIAAIHPTTNKFMYTVCIVRRIEKCAEPPDFRTHQDGVRRCLGRSCVKLWSVPVQHALTDSGSLAQILFLASPLNLSALGSISILIIDDLQSVGRVF